MKDWFRVSTRITMNEKVHALGEERHQLVWIGVLALYWQKPNRGLFEAKALRPFAVKCALGAFTVNRTVDEVAESLAKLREVGLLADEPDGAVRIVGYDHEWWPSCARCHRPNADDRFSTCPSCRGGQVPGTTVDGRAVSNGPAPPRRGSDTTARPQRTRSEGSRKLAAKGREGKVHVPSTHIPPSAEVASSSDPPVDGWVGGDAPQEPEGDGADPDDVETPPELVELFAVLSIATYRLRFGKRARLARTAQLATQGLTAHAARALWAHAQSEGRNPPGLFAKWIDGGTWRDVILDLDLEAKEAAIRARAPKVDSDDVGRIYGEPRAIADLTTREKP